MKKYGLLLLLLLLAGGPLSPVISFAEMEEAVIPTEGHFVKELEEEKEINDSAISAHKAVDKEKTDGIKLPKLNDKNYLEISFLGLLSLLFFCLLVMGKGHVSSKKTESRKLERCKK